MLVLSFTQSFASFTQLSSVINTNLEQDAMRSHNIITRRDWGQGFVLVLNRLGCVSHADACGLQGEELCVPGPGRPHGVIIVRNAEGGDDQ